MTPFTRALRGALALAALSAMSCGGGNPPGSSSSSSSPAPVAAASNVVAVTVDRGPTTLPDPSVNTLFTTVTICVPGSTTECQTIDHMQVDTGSYGVRILAPVLTLSLPVTVTSNGNALVECTQFVDGYSWGPVAAADVQIAGETANSVPVQVIGSSNFANVPDDCSSMGPAEDTVATFGANGIVGIGVFAQDCGSNCATTAGYGGVYYACPQTGACSPNVTVALDSQVQNPVPLFTTDNNGTLIVLPAVAAAGEATVAGSLIFGIDTQTNNASGSQTLLALDSDGNFTTLFNGETLNASFIDSGSNGLYFNDTAIAACTSTDFSGFYCPASTLNLTATMQGANDAASIAVPFNVGNAQTLADANPTFAVLPELAGTYAVDNSTTSSAADDTFDWGLPFFYGRRAAIAIEGGTTAVGTGPYVAF